MPTLQPGSTSQAFDVDIGQTVSVTPGSGGTMLVEYTTNSETDIRNGSATWQAWTAGTVSTATSDVAMFPMFARVTAYTAAGSYELSGSGLSAVPNQYLAWKSDVVSARDPVSAAAVVGAALNAKPRHIPAQIPVATFGDSIANISSYANFDLRQISGGAFSSNPDRMGVALMRLSNGALRVSANCGVSGDTTTQMLARDAAGASATRKALTDAMTIGCRHIVISAGINDLQNPALPGGSSASTIASTVSASVSRMTQVLRRAVSMGMIPHLPALLGYRYDATNGTSGGTNTLANVQTTQAAIALWNSQMSAVVQAAGGALGYWYDSFRPLIVDSSGAWFTGMDQGDGLHPSENATNIIYAEVARNILALENVSGVSPFAYPQGVNLFANADFSASSAGVATGVNPYVAVGTGTLSNQIITWRGQQWQESVLTPTGLDGNGNVSVQMDLTYSAPTTGDVLGGEISIYIDDGAGNPAPIFQYLARMRCNANFADCPNFNPTISPKVLRTTVIDGRYVPNPIVAPAAVTTSVISVMALTNQLLTPIRLRIARPRVVKLASSY